MPYSANQAVANARADVGWHEVPLGSNINPYSLWQYGVHINPYCASAVSKWSYDAGFRFWPESACGAKGDYNVTSFRIHAQNHGVWRPTSAIARPGWLCVQHYDLPDQHIELVLADAGDNVATIGANTSDGVWYRNRYRSNITGFIALDEAGQNGPPAPTPGGTPQEPTLKLGDTGYAVKQLQFILDTIAGAGLTVDGVFGPATDHVVRNFQRFFHLQVDGIVGPQTWGVLWYCVARKTH